MALERYAGDHCYVYYDDSATARLLESPHTVEITSSANVQQAGAFNDGSVPSIAHTPIHRVTLRGWVDTSATTGDHTVFDAGVGTTGTLTVQLGQNTTPTTGDPEFEGEFILSEYNITVNSGSPMEYNAVFDPSDETAITWSTVSA